MPKFGKTFVEGQPDAELEKAEDKMIDRTGVLIVLGLALIGLFLFGSWYTIDQTQRGVLLRNGAFVEVVQPGLHFKWPWIESVYKIDMQTHTRAYGRSNDQTGNT